MKLRQVMAMKAKSSNTVTLGLTSGSAFTAAPPPSTSNPVYLQNLSIAITSNLATADATFWGCPGYFLVEITRVT